MNLIFPLLHRPTFEKSLAEDLHLRDAGFGGVVSLVAAIGARFSSDPRVCVSGTDPTRSAGYMWFYQVQVVLRSFYSHPSLYDLQIYCVRCLSYKISDYLLLLINCLTDSCLRYSYTDWLHRNLVGLLLELVSDFHKWLEFTERECTGRRQR